MCKCNRDQLPHKKKFLHFNRSKVALNNELFRNSINAQKKLVFGFPGVILLKSESFSK